MNDYFQNLCHDRDNPYEIDLELTIRKILEKNTNIYFEFQKNDNIYEYDICCFNYTTGDKWSKNLLGYLEVEISENWETNYPCYWQDYSYCRRKIHKFDHVNNRYTHQLKENARNAVYIIFNKSLTDAFCNSMKFIHDNFILKKREFKNLDEYHSWFLTINKNSSKVVRGIKNCLDKISGFFKKQKKHFISIPNIKSETSEYR